MNKKILFGATLLAALTLSACSPAAPEKMPVASPTAAAASTAPPATKSPTDLLPKDKAQKESSVLLKTTQLQPGLTVRTYRVGTGEVVAQQLESNPTLKKDKVKVGDKVAVIRYTLKNTSGKPVDVIRFFYGAVFEGGSGRAADTDGGYASATARLGLDSTPLLQFTDKTGKSGNWSLKNNQEASWNTDLVLEADGVLLQNFALDKKAVNNIRIDLLKQS